jgi:N-acetylglucosaminyldiphosphoundecaprenol N-acetyl-beta-D-mannosaminyltransferase
MNINKLAEENTNSRRRNNFMNCPIDIYTGDQVLDELYARIASRDRVSIVNFLNVAKIVKARRNQQLMNVLWHSDFVLADGKPLSSFGRMLGISIPEQIAGIELMLRLIEDGQTRDLSIYLLGARQEVVEACVGKIREAYPRTRIAGYRNGYFNDGEVPNIIDEINSSRADILFVGIPTPEKEYFTYNNRDKLKVPVVQGVGGSFDVVAGLVKRAPRWMQQSGLEWFFRVIQEPRRMFWRYFSTNSIFILTFLWAALLYNRDRWLRPS